ncbi:MAG: hypothetical protein M3Q30_25495, partial [Actinomycetota bacterium]|nr:hypothetical protein [Actinomycetota bacterium]
SENRDISRMFWAYGLRGRPVRAIAEVLGDLIDASSVGGGTFDLGSATFDITRIVTGQLDAYVDVGRYVVDVRPSLEAAFRRVGDGAVCTNFPYDVAAAALIVEEAGGVVTRPDGASIAGHPAVGSGDGYGIAVVASASAALHDRLLAAIARGTRRLQGSVGD